MGHLQRLTNLTRIPAVYRAWQAPFVQDKLALLRRDDLAQARRVLDVGCGPGTNAPQFSHADYVGIDLSEAYIQTARRRHPNTTFLVNDVRTYQPDPQDRFDFVFINSLLHHLDDTAVSHILQSVGQQLTTDGYVHILELVLPEQRSLARLLAKLDRGDYPRPLESWRKLFGDVFDELVFEPYVVGRYGAPLWHMVYFKGRTRQ